MVMPEDNAWLLALIQENRGIIYKICRAYCPDPQHREDLAQEIIYQLWKSGKQYREGYKFSTWMYRVALNVAISYYRREKTKGVTFVPEQYWANLPEEPAGMTREQEYGETLQRFIGALKELDRAIIILYLDARSHAEIADIMGISESNVGTKIGRIKAKLKEKFSTL
jgi:RNA polymerase sigma factor (sigma-70 family)